MIRNPSYLTFTVHPLELVQSFPHWEATALPPTGKLSLDVPPGTRPQDLTARRVLRALRENKYLRPSTAGALTSVVESPDVLRIETKWTREPVLCLRVDPT